MIFKWFIQIICTKLVCSYIFNLFCLGKNWLIVFFIYYVLTYLSNVFSYAVKAVALKRGCDWRTGDYNSRAQILTIAVAFAVFGVLRYTDLITFSWEIPHKMENEQPSIAQRIIDGANQRNSGVTIEDITHDWSGTIVRIKNSKTWIITTVRCTPPPHEVCKIGW